ncbi:MAG TPA: M28 family peptidase [bacterium]|nr:M28 family peptidase [bacterium]
MPRQTSTRINEEAYIQELISRIVAECPRRQPTSPDERKAQEIMQAEFAKLDLDSYFHDFKFNDSLYKNMALHFGLGTLGTMVSGLIPPLGFILHSLAASSYWADSTRKAYILRRVFPFKPSQNLVVTIPARSEMKLRIVMHAHADAAFTGLLFNPEFIRRFGKEPPKALSFLKRSMSFTTKTQAALAGIDLFKTFAGPLAWPLRPLEAALTVPALLAFVLNMQIVLKNEIVPGANDDLSGVAALPLLAQRLLPRKRDDVEYVFIVTGCEEASLGGADALARDMRNQWDPQNTVVFGLDGITCGQLHYVTLEGEVKAMPIAPWLIDLAQQVAAAEPRFNEVRGYEMMVGGTDTAAFLARGYEGITLICLDPEIGAPFNYHMPQDTPENLDAKQVIFSLDFAEKMIAAIVDYKLG